MVPRPYWYTRSHIGKHECQPGTQNWQCNGFYFVLCFPFSDKYYISVYLSRKVLFCIHFLSNLHHDGMVHSIKTECTMLSSFQTKPMQVQSLIHN